MCLFLPHEKDGLPALVERVCTEPGFLDHHLPNTRVRVGDFRIPKFKITSSFEASQVLKELGLVLPFEVDPYNGGNLTEMVDVPPGEVPLVSSIFHKSFIEVNENGTEAAAVTFSSKVAGSCRPCHRPKPIETLWQITHSCFLSEMKRLERCCSSGRCLIRFKSDCYWRRSDAVPVDSVLIYPLKISCLNLKILI
ncbi:hypothetical protein C1H46_002231 [Malus baccata]|uniref:Serpin domain-containing protein n=1 Tax=Malus baccata TaxID=106549 RepID=A0A540NMA0_MALBA|nr:hypothetical protein C1H46_002231 [Malus baccata]